MANQGQTRTGSCKGMNISQRHNVSPPITIHKFLDPEQQITQGASWFFPRPNSESGDGADSELVEAFPEYHVRPSWWFCTNG